MQPEASRDPALFRHGMSPGKKCIIGLLLSLGLLLSDNGNQWSVGLRNGIERLMAPLMIALELPGEAARELGRGLSAQSALLRQIADLERENDRLRATARDLAHLQRENDEIRTLAGLPIERLELWRTVQLIQRGRGIAAQRFLIDAGTAQGVRGGMALVHPEGVIGQVIAAGEATADVALITDIGQNTPVESLRTGLRGVLIGEGVADRASLRFVASNADVEPGDALITSGLDGVYPAGLPVATIVSIKRDAQSDFARVVCKPAANIDGRRHFAVVVPSAAPDTAGPRLPQAAEPAR